MTDAKIKLEQLSQMGLSTHSHFEDQVTAAARDLGFTGHASIKAERQASEKELSEALEIVRKVPSEVSQKTSTLIKDLAVNIVLSGKRNEPILAVSP